MEGRRPAAQQGRRHGETRGYVVGETVAQQGRGFFLIFFLWRLRFLSFSHGRSVPAVVS